jgi:signal transduction histidine kinase
MGPISWIVKHWRGISLYVGVFVGLAILTAVEAFIAQQLWDKPITWTLAFRRSFKITLAYAVCTAPLLWLCGYLRFEAGRRLRWFFAHTLGALAFSVAIVALTSLLQAGERSVQTGEILTFSYLFKRLLVTYTISNIFKYWIVVLGHLGWHYYKAYRERERQTAALATELVQARLQALRMQINPHFLFNTLNTISALIRENPDAADRMIVRLSELLRRTLDRGDVQEVPLREEVDFLKSYLEIEQMRFPDRLTVTFDIEPKTNELFVPHLILQPLVENALRHGIMPREEAGRVEISARVSRWGERPCQPGSDQNRDTARQEPRPTTENQFLELKVRDNGNGLPADPNVLPDVPPAEPFSRPEDGTAGETHGSTLVREGIGLKNVRSRLAQLYGDAQEFTVSNTSGGGVEARIRIPCCTIPRSQAPQVVVMSATEASKAGLPLPTAAAAKPKCC